jgi:hypothetical protein
VNIISRILLMTCLLVGGLQGPPALASTSPPQVPGPNDDSDIPTYDKAFITNEAKETQKVPTVAPTTSADKTRKSVVFSTAKWEILNM